MTIIDIVHTAYEDRPRLVATLRSHRLREQALEEGFTATQNLETSWVESHGQHGIPITPGDEVRRRGQCRSTSVGDYARVVDTDGAEVVLALLATHRLARPDQPRGSGRNQEGLWNLTNRSSV